MQIRLGLVSILLLTLLPVQVSATVYGWKGDGGVLHLSNNPEDAPDPATETVTEYTSKLAQKAANTSSATETATPPAAPPAETEIERLRAYERGLERGLASAEEQVQMAAELARSVLTAVPPPPPRQPVQIVIQQAAPVVRHVSPAYTYNSPFYGFIGPYIPHSYFGHSGGYSYGFRQGRFPRHSHFSPGRRRGRRGIYFPRGHFSRDGFLFGHGIVLR